MTIKKNNEILHLLYIIININYNIYLACTSDTC